jgi:hypothetical protein
MDRPPNLAPHLPPEPKAALSLPIPWRRLRYNLWCIGWSQGELARRARLNESSIRQMCSGAKRCPDALAIHVERLAAIHRAMWEPPEWDPAGRSSFHFMKPPEGDDPDDTEVAPEQPRLYARDEHPDRLALLAEQAAANAIADDGAP